MPVGSCTTFGATLASDIGVAADFGRIWEDGGEGTAGERNAAISALLDSAVDLLLLECSDGGGLIATESTVSTAGD